MDDSVVESEFLILSFIHRFTYGPDMKEEDVSHVINGLLEALILIDRNVNEGIDTNAKRGKILVDCLGLSDGSGPKRRRQEMSLEHLQKTEPFLQARCVDDFVRAGITVEEAVWNAIEQLGLAEEDWGKLKNRYDRYRKKVDAVKTIENARKRLEDHKNKK